MSDESEDERLLDALRALVRSNDGRPVHVRREVGWPGFLRPRKGVHLSTFVREAFTQLTGEALEGPLSDGGCTYNDQTDIAYLCREVDAGILFAGQHFGLLPRDGVRLVTHVVLTDGTHLSFAIGDDYSQYETAVDAWGTSDATVARALDAFVAALTAFRDVNPERDWSTGR